jgi:hypothetical protein
MKQNPRIFWISNAQREEQEGKQPFFNDRD